MNTCDNKRPCPCTYDCPRHGKCCACVAHHRDHNEGVPGCFFSKEAEATYDRSIENLARDHGIIKQIYNLNRLRNLKEILKYFGYY